MNRTATRIVLWTVAIGSVAVIVWFIARDPDAVEALTSISPAEVVALLGLQCVYLFIESKRFEVVVEDAAATPLPTVPMVSLFAVGRVLNMIIPQSGNVYRGVALSTRFGVPAANFAGGLGAFVWMTVTLSSFTAAAVMTLTSPDLEIAGLPASAFMFIVGIVIALGPIAIYFTLGRLLPADGQPSVMAKVASIVRTMGRTATTPRLIGVVLLLWGGTLAIVVTMYWFTFRIAGSSPSIGALIALYALVQVTSFVVITPGNIGIQELGFAGLAVLLGVPLGLAAAAATLIRASGVIATVGVAAVTGWSDLIEASRTR